MSNQHDNEPESPLEGMSRRSFLGAGSAALAMDACGSQDEVDVKFFAHVATDEVLVGAAKSGIAPRLRSFGSDTRARYSRWLIGSRKTETMQKT